MGRLLKVAGLSIALPAALVLLLLHRFIEWHWWTPFPVLLIFAVPTVVGAVIFRVAVLAAKQRADALGCVPRAILGLISAALVGYGFVLCSTSGRTGAGTDHGGPIVGGFVVMVAVIMGLIAALFGAGLGQRTRRD